MCPRGRPRGQGRPRGLHLCYLCHFLQDLLENWILGGNLAIDISS